MSRANLHWARRLAAEPGMPPEGTKIGGAGSASCGWPPGGIATGVAGHGSPPPAGSPSGSTGADGGKANKGRATGRAGSTASLARKNPKQLPLTIPQGGAHRLCYDD